MIGWIPKGKKLTGELSRMAGFPKVRNLIRGLSRVANLTDRISTNCKFDKQVIKSDKVDDRFSNGCKFYRRVIKDSKSDWQSAQRINIIIWILSTYILVKPLQTL